MKKWIIPALALTLTCSTVSVPSHAFGWPFGKKTDQSQSTTTKSTTQTTTQNSDNSSGTAATPSDSGSTSDTAGPVNNQAANQPPRQTQINLPPKVQVQSPISDEVNGLKVEEPVESVKLPPDKTFVAVDDPKNPLGITTSAEKLNSGAQLISQKKYKEASATLNPLKDWLVDATEAHIGIYKTLKSIPSAQIQAELEKQLALQFALLRDKAFFQLGMLAIGQDDYSSAVKNLSKVVQSQPRSPMGAQAYEVLQKIGFSEKIQLKEDKKS